MDDKMIKTVYDSNSSYMTQQYMSVVPQQISSRPSTLSLNGQSTNNPIFFTPSDYAKYSLSTPDLINVLSSQVGTDETSSPGAKVLEEIFATQINDMNNQSMIPSGHNTYTPLTRRQPQTASRNRSISSSINDNDSSNSTSPSSPLSINRGRDELQHVPSMSGRAHGDTKEVVRKEKKRERNRQAAQKCRTRKLTRIAELQNRVHELQGKNKSLTNIAENLQTDIFKLEKQLQDHHTQGCTLINGSML